MHTIITCRWCGKTKEIEHRGGLTVFCSKECKKLYLRKYFCEYYRSEKQQAYLKQYYKRPEVIDREKTRCRERRKQPRYIAIQKRYWKSIKGKTTAIKIQHRRRAAIIENGIGESYVDWMRQIRSKRTFICYWCKERKPISEFTVDHIVPIKLKGRDDRDNVCASCRSCNHRKNARCLTDWCAISGSLAF